MGQKTNTGASIDELIDRLTHPRGSVRADAAYELSACNDATAFQPLIALLRDPIPLVRANAAYALYHLEARHIGEDLLPLLADPIVEVRLSAILAMGRCPEPRALAPLLALLEDPDEGVRAFVRQYGFGCLGSLAVPALLDRLHDDRDFMRAGAVRALSMMSQQRLAGAPDRVQERFPYTLSDDQLLQVVQALVCSLRDTDPSVRFQAIQALDAHGTPQAVTALLNALLVEEDQGIRSAIADCLRQSGAGPQLDHEIAAQDNAVRERAATGISHFIWSMLKDQDNVSARLSELAPEHRDAFDQVAADLTARYMALEIQVQDAVAGILADGLNPNDPAQRRKILYRAKRAVAPGLVQAVQRAVNGQSYEHVLWHELQPPAPMDPVPM